MDKWKSIIKALTNAKYVFISEYKYLPNMQDPISLHNKGKLLPVLEKLWFD